MIMFKYFINKKSISLKEKIHPKNNVSDWYLFSIGNNVFTYNDFKIGFDGHYFYTCYKLNLEQKIKLHRFAKKMFYLC